MYVNNHSCRYNNLKYTGTIQAITDHNGAIDYQAHGKNLFHHYLTQKNIDYTVSDDEVYLINNKPTLVIFSRRNALPSRSHTHEVDIPTHLDHSTNVLFVNIYSSEQVHIIGICKIESMSNTGVSPYAPNIDIYQIQSAALTPFNDCFH
ncbi:hypothetical protein [Photobacterium leiognathi]|uniref:hypothetical protein n=1 Tax=Photobacterium leiognathi TaxID=553611 RepID=UPI002981D7B3|nr:hypothetical protein [Photobacterium leiognathi]